MNYKFYLLSITKDESRAPVSCGGDVTNKTSITMPSHLANVTCIWRFTSAKTRRYFAITDFRLSPGAVLLVYDSDYKNDTNTSSIQAALTGNFTGTRGKCTLFHVCLLAYL